MWYLFLDQLNAMADFMHRGGDVLWVIAAVAFFLWALVFERLFYYNKIVHTRMHSVEQQWAARPERRSWHAHQVRRRLIAEEEAQIQRFLSLIATLVALCPLLGLLGTVTGMIDVFNVMAVTGGSDAKSMAGGVSKATLPTLAGMVVALSGIFAHTYLVRLAGRSSHTLENHLILEH